MKLFIWEYVVGITNNYHDGGGVVIIADEYERAWREEWPNWDGDVPEPDRTIPVGDDEQTGVYIFADAGCC